MKPIIGITGYYLDKGEIGNQGVRGLPGQDMAMYSYDYARSIERAGGIPVLLPIQSEDYIVDLLKRLDGLLLAGGADINPLLYGDIPRSYLGTVEAERDTFEFALARQALEADLPILGICRGLQVLNVVRGGSLYQDLERELGPDHFHTHRQFRKWQGTHSLRVLLGSKLHQAVGVEDLMVNSYHHQGVKILGQGLVATGWSHDHLVEALESTEHQYVAAVQWHPEMMSEKDAIQQQLFNHFVTQVCKK